MVVYIAPDCFSTIEKCERLVQEAYVQTLRQNSSSAISNLQTAKGCYDIVNSSLEDEFRDGYRYRMGVLQNRINVLNKIAKGRLVQNE